MIGLDAIVFNQKELDNAIDSGCTKICICGNSFKLPSKDGISYMGISDATAVIYLDRGENYDIHFYNFQPTVLYTGGYNGITEGVFEYNDTAFKEFGNSSSTSGRTSGTSGSGSYTAPYSTSYIAAKTSFATSFSAQYKAVYYALLNTSYNTSYRASYRTSYNTSYITSYKTSYNTSYTTSYRTSYNSSYRTSSGGICGKYFIGVCDNDGAASAFTASNDVFYAAGYGLNLI